MFWELPALLQWEQRRSHTDMVAVGTEAGMAVEGMVAEVITAVAGCTMAAAAWEVAACTITMAAVE